MAAIVHDHRIHETLINIESERRMSEAMVASLKARIFLDAEPEDAAYILSDDNYLKLWSTWYF